MVGFQLLFDGKKTSASLQNGGVMLLANKVLGGKPMNTIELTLTGYDRDNNNMITWFSKEELKLGDEFTLRVADILENSPPLEVNKRCQKKI